MAGKKVNYTNVSILILLLVIFLISCSYWDQLKLSIKYFFEWKFLSVSVYGIAIILAFAAYATKTEINNEILLTNKFGSFFDLFTSCITYSTGIVSGLALLKGFYVQKIFEEPKYFLIFSELDLWLLAITMGFLLFVCFKRLAEILLQVVRIEEESAAIDNK